MVLCIELGEEISKRKNTFNNSFLKVYHFEIENYFHTLNLTSLQAQIDGP